MESIKKKLPGVLTCFIIAVPSWLLGKTFPIIGGPVIAILAGMLITMVWKNKGNAETGIKWTSNRSSDCGCIAGIWNESWCNPADRQAVTADHRVYDQYISDLTCWLRYFSRY